MIVFAVNGALATVLTFSGSLAAEKKAAPAPWPFTRAPVDDLADPPPKERPALFIPPRPKKARTGSQILAATAALSLAEREAVIEAELMRGNIPAFLRHFTPIRLHARLENGLTMNAWAFVMPDYLAVGSDRDYIRVPMNPYTAQRVADSYDARLPTSKIVDAAYTSAKVPVPPHPLPANEAMRSNAYLAKHESFIHRQLLLQSPGKALIAGHKKDVVISNRLISRAQRVAIYGWHMPNGEAIQTLSTVHKKSYSDYSHGIRLVLPTVLVGDDKQEWSYDDLLQHPSLWMLVSDEGPFEHTRYADDEPIWSREELAAPLSRLGPLKNNSSYEGN